MVRNWFRTLMMVVLPALCAHAQARATFVNPLLPAGPDPWVLFHDGFYYYMNSTGTNLTLRKTRDITDLANAQKRVMWTPPATGPYSHEIWAPELHQLDGKWYIYFAADDGSNDHHRLYVLENEAADPIEGSWTFKGKVADPTDKWAIDATVFTLRGRNYIVWSGWEGDTNGVQSIYLAQLRNPWTIEGQRMRLSTPQYPWERVGDFGWNGTILSLPHVDVNEGPEILQHGDRTFLIYSASGCWTNYYELGMLSLRPGADPMDSAAWTKSDRPVFWQNPDGHAYGTGHNGFFPSPDGRQNWIIYHANPGPNQGCGNQRSPRVQPFTWNPDSTPNFGRPVPLGQPLEKPSGTPQ
ncbi:MAG TPA: glycoside hydrolase family 43 protein [Acidobacteriaceae bacterium]|nr:glycoside hydrolase family 43 protein [Acidobacteriaceae bacterium]